MVAVPVPVPAVLTVIKAFVSPHLHLVLQMCLLKKSLAIPSNPFLLNDLLIASFIFPKTPFLLKAHLNENLLHFLLLFLRERKCLTHVQCLAFPLLACFLSCYEWCYERNVAR